MLISMSTVVHLPSNEAQRLQAVQPYLELPTRHEVFQEVVALTAQLFEAPISMMSLVEAEQVQYPGKVGFPTLPPQLARTECICSAAVYTSTTTIFPDLRAQPCPWVSPAAQAQDDFCFYAGHPLLTQTGYAVGTLCVLDVRPRAFSESDTDLLQRLAQVAMQLLELHLTATVLLDQPATLWDRIRAGLAFSLERIETLLALARRAGAPAATYQQDLQHQKRLLVEALDYNIGRTAIQVAALPRKS